MREIRCTEIVDTIREMCMEAACFLSDDMKEAMNQAVKEEVSSLGKQVLDSLNENLEIAEKEMIRFVRIQGWQSYF